jgi:hypothetical protein
MTKKRPVRSLLRPIFPSVALFARTLGLVYSKRSALREWGYIESTKSKKPCRRDGSPLPWMNYQVIHFLEQRLTRDLSVFEYGSGNSTNFFAALVKDVTSVETDAEWHAHVLKTMPPNVHLVLFDMSSKGYSELAKRQNHKFDVIVVDSHDRPDCLMQAPAALTDRGVVLLDDAQRDDYGEAIDWLLSQGFRKLDFEGLKPAAIRAYRTTVFYRDNNCLGI